MTGRPNQRVGQTFATIDLRDRASIQNPELSEPATAYPGTRLSGEVASGASRRANVSRTVAEPILVAGKHHVELRRRDSSQLTPRLRQLVAAWGAGGGMG